MGYSTYFNNGFDIEPPLPISDKSEFDRVNSVHGAPSWWTMLSDWPARNPEPHRCDWHVNDEGNYLENDGEKTYDYVEQLEYLIKDFFAPRGYVLNGEVGWSGEEDEDIGKIFIKNNEVRSVQATVVIKNPFE